MYLRASNRNYFCLPKADLGRSSDPGQLRHIKVYYFSCQLKPLFLRASVSALSVVLEMKHAGLYQSADVSCYVTIEQAVATRGRCRALAACKALVECTLLVGCRALV